MFQAILVDWVVRGFALVVQLAFVLFAMMATNVPMMNVLKDKQAMDAHIFPRQ